MRINKMKSIITLVFACLSLLVSSQSYESIFSEDTTKWHVVELIPDCATTKAYYSYSDSIIENKKYFKLYSEYVDSETKIGKNGFYCGLIYEDTINGKYWFRKETSDGYKEALFIDFSLEQGDTTEIVSDFRYMWKDSVAVDTVYRMNSRKVIELNKVLHDGSGNTYNVQYIEGIGSSYGFYMAEGLEEPNEQVLLCKFNQNELIYSSVSNVHGNCYLHSVGIKQLDKKYKVNVYPNPSNGFITVEVDNSLKNLRLEILNSMGQVINYDKSNTYLYNLTLPKEGLYFIRIYLEKDIIVKKIINNGY